jgi:hypothetical protein
LITSTIEKILLFAQLECYLFEEDELWAWLRIGEYIEKIGNLAALLFAYDPRETGLKERANLEKLPTPQKKGCPCLGKKWDWLR